MIKRWLRWSAIANVPCHTKLVFTSLVNLLLVPAELIEKDQPCEISFRLSLFPFSLYRFPHKPYHFFSALFLFHFHVLWVGQRRHSTVHPHLFCLHFYHNLSSLSLIKLVNPSSHLKLSPQDWDPSFFGLCTLFTSIPHHPYLQKHQVSLLSPFLIWYVQFFNPLKFIDPRLRESTY